jgi:hypothetical protein
MVSNYQMGPEGEDKESTITDTHIRNRSEEKLPAI